MTTSSMETINIVFIAIYVILLPFNLYNLIKHSLQKKAAYIFLIIFDLVRIAGNAVLVAAEQEEKNPNANVNTLTNLYTAGYVMQGLGYGFLLSSTMSFYNRAIGYDKKEEKKKSKATGQKTSILVPSRLFHLVNLAATILLIVGLTNSTSAYTPAGGPVSSIAKAGSYLYCVVTGLVMIMTFYHLFIKGPITNASRILLIFVGIALIPMSMRVGYSTYRFQTDSITNYNVWVHLVFQDIVEVLSVIIYIILGFYLAMKGGDYELDQRKDVMNNLEQANLAEKYPASSVNDQEMNVFRQS